MPAGTVVGPVVDVAAARRTYEAAELAFDEAAHDERAQYERWQESFGASQVARDEADPGLAGVPGRGERLSRRWTGDGGGPARARGSGSMTRAMWRWWE